MSKKTKFSKGYAFGSKARKSGKYKQKTKLAKDDESLAESVESAWSQSEKRLREMGE